MFPARLPYNSSKFVMMRMYFKVRGRTVSSYRVFYFDLWFWSIYMSVCGCHYCSGIRYCMYWQKQPAFPGSPALTWSITCVHIFLSSVTSAHTSSTPRASPPCKHGFTFLSWALLFPTPSNYLAHCSFLVLFIILLSFKNISLIKRTDLGFSCL